MHTAQIDFAEKYFALTAPKTKSVNSPVHFNIYYSYMLTFVLDADIIMQLLPVVNRLIVAF